MKCAAVTDSVDVSLPKQVRWLSISLKNHREGWTISLYQDRFTRRRRNNAAVIYRSPCAACRPVLFIPKLLSEALKQSKLERACASKCPQRAAWMLAGGSVSWWSFKEEKARPRNEQRSELKDTSSTLSSTFEGVAVKQLKSWEMEEEKQRQKAKWTINEEKP